MNTNNDVVLTTLRDYGLPGLIFQIIFALVYTYGIGLFLPLIIRYVFYKRPLSKTASGWYAFFNSGLNFIFTASLIILFPDYFQAINPKTFLVPYIILFFVARWVMMLKSKKPKGFTREIDSHKDNSIPGANKTVKRFYWKSALLVGFIFIFVNICFSVFNHEGVNGDLIVEMVCTYLLGFLLTLIIGWTLTYPHLGWKRLAIVMFPISVFGIWRLIEKDGDYEDYGLFFWYCATFASVLLPMFILVIRDVVYWVINGFAIEKVKKDE